MGKSGSKLKEELIINNNGGTSTSNIANTMQNRLLGDIELILIVLGILAGGFIIIKKLKEYLNKTVKRQIAVERV